MNYFKSSEFDSPDVIGSGSNMQQSTLDMLNVARAIANVPFVINSGFRTPEYNKKVGGVGDSAHTLGLAADIAVNDKTRDVILKALYKAGFRRFGIGAGYVHADNDSSKPQNVIWYYPQTPVILKQKYNGIKSIVN